ncbi:MAG: ribonuclease PH [Candidatus Omnitrophica bacterium]|nr:ribonuclease PH [Candidatus Omnitrophota bacterium]
MKRKDQRLSDQLRKLNIERGFMKNSDGSCLIEIGDTKVICAASVDRNVPLFLRNSGQGWVTAEYGMLPRSTNKRMLRDKITGRRMEIQRLIGRSLRNVVNLNKLGERTIWIDCDVIQADGGTRTASVVGGFIALADCVYGLQQQGKIGEGCICDLLGAISVGVVKGEVLLDLSYHEDSRADVDMNVVMKGSGEFIEVQGTGENSSFSQDEFNSLIDLARKGINEIIELQKQLLKTELANIL